MPAGFQILLQDNIQRDRQRLRRHANPRRCRRPYAALDAAGQPAEGGHHRHQVAQAGAPHHTTVDGEPAPLAARAAARASARFSPGEHGSAPHCERYSNEREAQARPRVRFASRPAERQLGPTAITSTPGRPKAAAARMRRARRPGTHPHDAARRRDASIISNRQSRPPAEPRQLLSSRGKRVRHRLRQ